MKKIIVLVILILMTNLALSNAAPLSGQIMVDPQNPSWLVYNKDENGDGKPDPFFMAGPGDPEDFLYRGSRNSDGTRNGDQLTLINKLKSTGANSIYMQIIRSHGGDGDSTHNPFINNDPSQGINTKVLDQWETWFAEMDNAGITIFLFLYDDSARVWNTGDTVGIEERNFIQTIVNRFKHHKHLIWVVAEEYEEAYSAKHVSNIAAEIRLTDDYDHVIAVHKLSGLDFSEFADDPNIDQFAVQYNVSTPQELHNGMVTASNNAAGRYNLNMSEAAGHGNGTIARQKNWAVAMGGAYVMALGWDIASTSINDLQDAGCLVSFMQSTNFNEMAPHDELKYGGTEYVLAKPGESYIAYASNLAGNIGLKNMTSGTYDFKWYDVTNGNTVIQQNINVASGDQAWTKPATIGNELAVYIKKTGAVPPSVVFPGASWQTKTPQELGLDDAKLNQLASNVGGNGVIVKDGYIVKTWGNPASKDDWASAFKPVVSTMLFFAVNEGKLASVDSLIDPWWNGALISKDKTMKFRHLADMTSGYARGEAPGAAWAYNDYAIKLYVMTLFDKVYQESPNAAATKSTRLGGLQFQDGSIFSSRGGYGVYTSPRDFARIGWFWLNKGNWNGTQLLPKSYFDNYMKVDVPKDLPRTTQGGSDYLGVGSVGGESDQGYFGPGMYGFNWWFNAEVGTTGKRPWPDAPDDMFMASGHGGLEQVVVYPSLGIVAAAIGNWGDVNDAGQPNSTMNSNFKLLKEAATATAPDTTPPSTPTNLISPTQTDTSVSLSWSSSLDPESGISKYIIYRDNIKVGESSAISFIDTALSESTTYTYEASAVNGAGLESNKSSSVLATTKADTTASTITSVSSSGDPTKVTVIFSEPVEQASSTNTANYNINNSILISSASLGLDLKTVTLTTSTHQEGITYTLTVNNIKDRAKTPNAIVSNTQKAYSYISKLIISNLSVASGKNYQVVEDGLKTGALSYIDRSYTFTSIPNQLQGSTYIKTANEDKLSQGDSFLSFDVNQDVTIYIAHDNRYQLKPTWLTSFADSGQDLSFGDTFSIFKKDFPKGRITLGGNANPSEVEDNNMYTVIIVPKADLPSLKGDVNQDSSVDVLDVQKLVNIILGAEPTTQAADVNTDSSVDVLDVQEIVNIILGG